MVDRLGMTKLHRRRSVAAELPMHIAQQYSQGGGAVLAVIARVARRSGQCDLHYDRIAVLAGVSKSTVRSAVKEAEAKGHVIVRSRNAEGLSNLIAVAFG